MQCFRPAVYSWLLLRVLRLVWAMCLLQHASTAVSSVCVHEVAQCDKGVATVNQPDYNLAISTTTTDQYSVCLTTQPNSTITTTIAVNMMYGEFCTDRMFSPSLPHPVCVRNISSGSSQYSVLYFTTGAVSDEAGATTVTFTSDGGIVSRFKVLFAPVGVSRLSPTVVHVTAGDLSSISWVLNGVNDSELAVTPSLASSRLEQQAVNCVPSQADGAVAVFQRATYFNPSSDVEDSGDYSLTMSGGVVYAKSTIQVIVESPHAPPVLDVVAESVVFVEVGHNRSIHCNIVGTRRKPVWYYNNAPLPSNQGYIIEEDSLKIGPVQLTHSGWYTCAAANEYGRTEHDYLIIAGEPPRFMSPVTYSYQPNSKVVLLCKVTGGVPQPVIKWYKNGVELVDGVGGVRVSAISGALTVSKSSAVQYDSSFWCVASNAFNSTMSTPARIRKLATTNLPPSPLLSEYTLANAGEQVTLVCSDPVPTMVYVWYKDHTVIANATASNFTVKWTQDGSTWGHYCCKILTRNGSRLLDRRCTVVTVRVKPTIVHSPINASIPTGRLASLLCLTSTANHIDLPMLTWSREGRQLPPTTNVGLPVSLPPNGLVLYQALNTSTSDTGVYMCSGSNSVGSVQTVSEIRVVGRCTSNVLRSPGAEEEISTQNDWKTQASLITGPVPNITTNANGDRIFVIDATQPHPPSIEQTVSLPSNLTQLHFSGRMRSNTPSSAQPIISLVVGDMTTNITLPFPNSPSWQWVEHIMEINLTESSQLRVSMAAVGDDRVFFDDMCLSVSAQPFPPSTPSRHTPPPSFPTSPLPSLSPSQIPTSDSNTLLIGVGVSVGLLVLAVVIVATAVTGYCCHCHYRYKMGPLSRLLLPAPLKHSKNAFNLDGTSDSGNQTSHELHAPYLEVLDNPETGQFEQNYSYVALDSSRFNPTLPIPVPAHAAGLRYMKLLPTTIEHHVYTATSRGSSILAEEDKSKEEEEEEEEDIGLYESIEFSAEYVEPNPVREENRTDKRHIKIQ